MIQTKFQNSSGSTSSHSQEETIRQLKNEIELRDQYEKELEESRRVAELATQYKSQFLANMSHEIRTPLGLILGFTEELIKSSQVNPANKQLIHTIRRNSEILARLINDILDISKIEAGKIEFEVGPIRTDDLMDELETNFQAKCMEKGLLFHLDFLSNLPEVLYTDEVRLKQILFNLVSNGIKHTEKGGVVLKVSFSEHTGHIHFDVIDSGQGIPCDKQIHIFETFKQLHKGKPGAGLGLALSRNLARGLQGDLRMIRSEPGQGSWFRVNIKNQTEMADQVHMPHKPLPLQAVLPDLSGWKILVVDDLPDNLRLMEAILRPTKAQIESTSCSFYALTKTRESQYNLILLDLEMPEQDGFQTLKRMREGGCQHPVWAVSAHAMKNDLKKSQEAGFNDHIAKPIQRPEFYRKLKALQDSHRWQNH